MTTCDKLIFPLAIMRILRHFSISYAESTHFSAMCAIDAATVRRSEAQIRLKRSQIEMATPLTFSAPSTSAPSSLAGVVTLEAVMVQLQCMDAHLNTLCNELCQVNTRVGRIAQWQARLGGFVESPSPSLEASEDEDDDGDSDDDDDGDSDDDDDDEDEDDCLSYLSFVIRDKKGE